MLSVEAVQPRSIRPLLTAVAESPEGAEGGAPSGAVGTMDASLSAWISVWVSARL